MERLVIEFADGTTQEVAIALGDMVRWERHFDKPIAALSTESDVRIEWIMYLAWSALGRTSGDDVGTFDEFLDNVSKVQQGAPNVAPLPPPA